MNNGVFPVRYVELPEGIMVDFVVLFFSDNQTS
jgi:hypothetical protein